MANYSRIPGSRDPKKIAEIVVQIREGAFPFSWVQDACSSSEAWALSLICVSASNVKPYSEEHIM